MQNKEQATTSDKDEKPAKVDEAESNLKIKSENKSMARQSFEGKFEGNFNF